MISAFVLVFTGGLYAAETLSLLTWKGYAPKNLIEQFEKETGITVKVT
ncbi:MAG: spermidine/putrescine ABC transporter substrate-binding protein, partial [Deltaproteobacteria bacterium]|nr:spermidine/putrescine ABC transporter substrate-binding protein [Deltaproteobacteria bacterium]